MRRGRRGFVDRGTAKTYLVRVTEDTPQATDMIPEKGLVLFSGGQDSTTCLAWALTRFAAAVGYRRGARHLVGGMCETDYSGYPDCRDDTLKALQATLSLGMDHRFVIHTPLMWRDKAATWELARRLGGGALVELVREETHSCYLGDREHFHPWGYGCGDCPACGLRRKGWEAFCAHAPRGSSTPAR